MGKTVSCGNDSAASKTYIANAGINTKSLHGYWEKMVWVDGDVRKSVAELQDKATFDALVATGDAIYIGKGKFADTSTEAAFFEDNDLEIKVEQTPRVLSVDVTSQMCPCTSAELEKLENKTGRIFIQTSTGQLQGVDYNGQGAGLEVGSMSVNSTIPVQETPVEYTVISITFANYKYWRANPFRIDLDYGFDEIDQVESAEGVAAGATQSGGTLTDVITITKGCSTEKVNGLVIADFKATDKDGNDLVVASVSETDGVYTIGVTTALTTAYLATDGIKEKNNILYYMNKVTLTDAS